MESINPATGEIIGEYKTMNFDEVDRAIVQAHEAYRNWRDVSFSQRTVPMKNAARILLERKEEFARLISSEMGKVLQEGVAEIEKCAWGCEYFADHAESLLAPEHIDVGTGKSYITYQPQGVLLAVMPWNFPFWQVFRFLSQALMAGNGAVLKHASNVAGCAVAIEEVVKEAGFPKHLFRSLLIGSDQVEKVIRHPKIRAVTLTGSAPAGRAVAACAGDSLKKSILELGGSDPYIILGDADLKDAAQICTTSRLINAGQTCISAKRFIVVKTVQSEFEKYFIDAMGSIKEGDPLEESTGMGPLARKDLRDDLHAQVCASVEKGARLLLGGDLPDGVGFYYPPTILTNVTPGMPAYDEELFGPVAAVITAQDEEDAIRIANDTMFGLGAAVFTGDIENGERIAATRLQAGLCSVNDFVRSVPMLPFGGVKESGFGRELGAHGIRELTNIKTVHVR